MNTGKVHDSHNPGFPAYISGASQLLCGTETLIKRQDPLSVGKTF